MYSQPTTDAVTAASDAGSQFGSLLLQVVQGAISIAIAIVLLLFQFLGKALKW
jgi:hypothetical protein